MLTKGYLLSFDVYFVYCQQKPVFIIINEFYIINLKSNYRIIWSASWRKMIRFFYAGWRGFCLQACTHCKNKFGYSFEILSWVYSLIIICYHKNIWLHLIAIDLTHRWCHLTLFMCLCLEVRWLGGIRMFHHLTYILNFPCLLVFLTTIGFCSLHRPISTQVSVKPFLKVCSLGQVWNLNNIDKLPVIQINNMEKRRGKL